jgi:hypothetical protein
MVAITKYSTGNKSDADESSLELIEKIMIRKLEDKTGKRQYHRNGGEYFGGLNKIKQLDLSRY